MFFLMPNIGMGGHGRKRAAQEGRSSFPTNYLRIIISLNITKTVYREGFPIVERDTALDVVCL